MEVRLSDIIAPHFYDIHKDIKEHNRRLGEITKTINKLNKSLEEP